MIGRRWRLYLLGAVCAAVVASMLVPSSRQTILGSFLHRAGSRTTQTAFFASGGEPGRPPDITLPPSRDGRHTGRIWVDPSGAQLHEGRGHTGVDSPYHLHPPDPNRPGHRLPGPGTPIDSDGKPIRQRHNTMAAVNDPWPGLLVFPLADPDPNESIHGYPLPEPEPTHLAHRQKAGGILLSQAALGNLGNLKGAVYDPDTHSLVVVGAARQKLPPITEAEWAVLLKCALDGTDPGFSLDPANPSNPNGPLLRCRYMPESLAGTPVGMGMYACDIRMKREALGLESPGVPRFKNLFQLGFAHAGRQPARLCRMWNETERVNIRRSGNAVVIDDAVMRVKTENMVASRLGIQSTGREDPDALWIAEFLTSHYSDLPAEYQRVKQLAAAYALAKFLVDQGVSIDREWLDKALVSVKTPVIVSAANVTRQNETVSRKRVPGGVRVETVTSQITIHGGIHLCVSLPRDTNDPAARKLGSSVIRALRGDSRITRFSLADGSVAAVIPMPGIALGHSRTRNEQAPPITSTGLSCAEDVFVHRIGCRTRART